MGKNKNAVIAMWKFKCNKASVKEMPEKVKNVCDWIILENAAPERQKTILLIEKDKD